MEKLLHLLCCFPLLILFHCHISNGNPIEDQMMQYADNTLQELLDRYEKGDHYNFWHPNTFKTGVQSREVVKISNVQTKFIPGLYKQWKAAKLGTETVIIGITSHEIDFYDDNLRLTGLTNTNETLVTFTTFGTWNDNIGRVELVIAIATDMPSLEFYSYTGISLTHLGSWPIQDQVKLLETCVADLSTKIIIVPEDNNAPIYVNSFEIYPDSGRMWYFQKFDIIGHTCVSVQEIDSSCSIAVASDTNILLFGYEPNAQDGPRFVSQNSLRNITAPCHQLISLSLSHGDYLAYVPTVESHRPIELLSVSGFNYLNQNAEPIYAVELASLPVGNIKNEDILLVRTPYNTTRILSYDGLQRTFKETFRCTSELCPEVSDLTKGVGTLINGTTVYFVPTQEATGYSTVFKISSQIDEYTSPIYEKARQLYDEFRFLSGRFVRYENIIKGVKEALQDSLSQTEPNVISGNWTVRELTSFNVEIFDSPPNNGPLIVGQNFQTIEFMNIPLHTEDFIVDDEETEAQLKIFETLVVSAEERTEKTVPLKSDQVFQVTAIQNINAEIQTSSLVSRQILVGGINDVMELDTFFSGFELVENSHLQIHGRTEFNGIFTVTNLEAIRVNGIFVNSFALLSARNVFNTSITFENQFTVVNAVLTHDLIADLYFPRDLILASNITDVTLNNLVALEKVQLVGPVGSVLIDPSEFEKNILLKDSTPQNVTSHITFNTMVLRKNGTVTTLNGKNFVQAAKSVVVRSQNGTIRGTKTFQFPNVTAEYLVIIKTLNTVPFPSGYISSQDEHIILHGYDNFSHIIANSVEVSGTLNNINTNGIIRRDSVKRGFIPSTWTLGGFVYFADDLQVRSIVAGVNVSDFNFHDTFDIPKGQYLPNHNIRFDVPVVLNNGFQVFKTVNDKTFDESFGNALLCADNGENIIVKGVTTFQNNVQFGNLLVESNQVNGINLHTFFMRNREQNITNNFVFTQPIHFSKIFALSKVDGVYFQNIFEDAIFLNKDQTFPPALVLESIISLAPVTIDGGPINNFTNFALDVARKSFLPEQTFQSHIVVTDAQVKTLNVLENFSTLNSINGLNMTRWNEERVSLSRQNVVVTQPIEILGKVIVQKSVHTDSINNISLSYLNHGVLREDRAEQTFLSQVHNSGSVLVKANVQIEQFLNGYSFAEVIQDSIPLHGSTVEYITGHWRLENAVFHQLYVNGTVCGIDLLRLNWDSVRINSTNVTFTGVTIFEGNVEAEDQIQTQLVNSIDFFNTVFTLNTPQVITAEIIWKNDVNIQTLLKIQERINGVSLTELNSIYSFQSQNHTHTIHSGLQFDSSFYVDNLVVTGLVQNINVSQFLKTIVLKNSSTIPVIHGNLFFTHPIISEGNIYCEAVNGIRVSVLAQSLVRKNSPFNFTHPVCFNQPLTVHSLILEHGNILTVNNLVSQIDIHQLQLDSIPLNSSKPEFSETLVFENLSVIGNIDGVVSVNDIPLTDFITLRTEQNLGSLKVFNSFLTQNNVTTRGLFGGVDLLATVKNTVLITNQSGLIIGEKNFVGPVTINGEFHCLGTEIIDQFVYIQEPNQVIQSPVIFLDDVNVLNNLIFKGKWNNYSLEELKEYGMSSYGEDVISADWNYPGGIIFNNYTISHGLIDGVNLTLLQTEFQQKLVTAENVLEKEQGVLSSFCHMYKTLYDYSTRSPIKLQSFDEQQLIISERFVREMLTVKAGHSLFLLVLSETDMCGVDVRQWSTSHEEFHLLGEGLVSDPVSAWAGTSHLDFGLIVFTSSSSSNCGQGIQVDGLYFALVNEFGAISPKILIQQGQVVDFKLVTDESKTITLLFVVYQESPQNITIYSWLNSDNTFRMETNLSLTSPVNIMDLSQPHNGIVEILIQTSFRASVHVYSLKDKSLTELSHADFYGSSLKTSMKLFQVDGSSYALILNKNSERSSIKPDSGLQLFKSVGGELKFVQKLKIYDLVSIEILRIGPQVFVVVLTKPVGLYVYKFMGLGGLQSINNYPLRFSRGEHLRTFHITPWRYNISLPFVLVSSKNVINLYHSNVVGNAVTEQGLQNNYDFCNFNNL